MRKILGLLFINFIVTSAYSSSTELFHDQDKSITINFSKLIPSLKNLNNVIIEKDTPEFHIICAYERLRGNLEDNPDGSYLSFSQFRKQATMLEVLINLPIDSSFLKEQKVLQDVLISMREALYDIIDPHEPTFYLLGPIINPIAEKIADRLDFARLDQQLYENKAFRGHIRRFDQFLQNDTQSPPRIGRALSDVIGKIFQVIEDEEGQIIVGSTGSGVMTKLTDGLPQSIDDGDELNGIITAAHILDCRPGHRIKGVYFVPCYALSAFGYPKNIKTSRKLIDYLQTSEDSYSIINYTIGNWSQGEQTFITNNNILSTNPQYRENEDIVFCEMSKKYKYLGELKITFPMSNDTKPIDGVYFAVGYPECAHYGIKDFENTPGYTLLQEEFAIAPLVITKGEGSIQFKQGSFTHKAPTASGMSGGPLIKLKEDDNGIYTIIVLGCIAITTDNTNNKGCYHSPIKINS